LYTDVSEEYVSSILRDEIGLGNSSLAREVVMRSKAEGKEHE
jgi:hypothetical protein